MGTYVLPCLQRCENAVSRVCEEGFAVRVTRSMVLSVTDGSFSPLFKVKLVPILALPILAARISLV